MQGVSRLIAGAAREAKREVSIDSHALPQCCPGAADSARALTVLLLRCVCLLSLPALPVWPARAEL